MISYQTECFTKKTCHFASCYKPNAKKNNKRNKANKQTENQNKTRIKEHNNFWGHCCKACISRYITLCFLSIFFIVSLSSPKVGRSRGFSSQHLSIIWYLINKCFD